MRVDLFDFELPDERIALRPAVPRDAAKMLVVKPSNNADARAAFTDAGVLDLASYLSEGDAIVFNDTKVIPAQFEGKRIRGENEINVSAPRLRTPKLALIRDVSSTVRRSHT